MAAPTYTQLQAAVLRRLIDAPPAVTAEVASLVLDAVKEVQDRFSFPWMRAEAAFTTTAGVTSGTAVHLLGATPTNFKEWREKPYWIEFTQGRVHKFAPVRAKQPALDGTPDLLIGPPRYVVQDVEDETAGTSNLLIYPQSDNAADYSDGQYRVRLPYYKYLAELVNPSDTNVMLQDRRIVRFVTDWATKLGFELNWDPPKAAAWEQIAEKEWLKIEGREGSRALLGIDTLAVHMDVDWPRVPE